MPSPFNYDLYRRNSSTYFGNDPLAGRRKQDPRNPWGLNIPTTPTPTTPTSNTSGVDDILAQYEKLYGNRPNRLAYQKAVEEGEPEIERSKWAKLGAAITAGGSALGGMDPGNASKLALSAYYAPEQRARESYDKKLEGLARLSQFEDTDVNEKARLLDARRDEYYRNEDLKLRRTESERQGKYTEAQIRSLDDELNRRGWITLKEKDGNTYFVNTANPKEKRLLGNTEFTPKEQLDQKKQELIMELDTRKPYEIDKEGREQKNALERIDATGENQMDVQNARDQHAADRVADRVKAMAKPGDRYAQAWLDIGSAISADKALSQPGLLDKNELGQPVVTPNQSPEFYYADENAAREKLRPIVAKAMENAAKPPAPAPVNRPGGSATQTPEGFVRMIDPNGKEFDAPQAEVQKLLSIPNGPKLKTPAKPPSMNLPIGGGVPQGGGVNLPPPNIPLPQQASIPQPQPNIPIGRGNIANFGQGINLGGQPPAGGPNLNINAPTTPIPMNPITLNPTAPNINPNAPAPNIPVGGNIPMGNPVNPNMGLPRGNPTPYGQAPPSANPIKLGGPFKGTPPKVVNSADELARLADEAGLKSGKSVLGYDQKGHTYVIPNTPAAIAQAKSLGIIITDMSKGKK